MKDDTASRQQLREQAVCFLRDKPAADGSDGEARAIVRKFLKVLDAPSSLDLVEHLTRQRAFSDRTFGPGARTAGVVDHIRKELREIEASPHDLSEWIDVVILGFDGAGRAGHSPEAIVSALIAKQARNEAREWPDWRTQPLDKAIEHVRPSPRPRGATEEKTAARSYRCDSEPKGETRIAELALAAARDVVTDLRVNGASLCEKGAAEAEFIVWIATVLEQHFREPLAEVDRLTTALAEHQ